MFHIMRPRLQLHRRLFQVDFWYDLNTGILDSELMMVTLRSGYRLVLAAQSGFCLWSSGKVD